MQDFDGETDATNTDNAAQGSQETELPQASPCPAND
jgi:hypothetical protein